MPWSRDHPHPFLVEWAGRANRGRGGCGLGADAEFVAGLRFRAVALDVSVTAIGLALERYPDTAVR
jgi:hypothetical protein